MSYVKFLKEVEKEFLKLGKPYSKVKQNEISQTWFKGTSYIIYNISNGTYKKLLKHPFSFQEYNFSDKAKIWSYIFKNTKYLQVGSLAIDYFKQFQNKKSYDLKNDWKLLKTWIHNIENWVHGDMLSGLYCDILSKDPKTVYPQLITWSQHKNPWKNRMAMLSLLYYYNPKRSLLPYPKYINLVKPHIHKDHYYLQKAIGWTLRELLKPYPKKTWAFINKNVVHFSPTAFTTIVENVSKKNKEPLKQKRKQHRKKMRALKK